MANTIAGMFADPNSFRDERLNDLMKQRQAISNMGGSMNQLLGQVAAGGGATGAMMAEGLGGMFGLKTREEAQAAQLQDMASNFDLDTSAGLTAFAKQLNDMGMTKEAVQILEKRNSVIDRERRMAEEDTEKAMREGKIREGIPKYEMRVRTDSKGNTLIGPNGKPLMERVKVPTYERWSEKEQRWIPTTSPSGSTDDSGFMADWGKVLTGQGSKVSDPSNPAGIATNMPQKGTGAHALKDKDASTQAAMVQAYANYLKSLPAGTVPMEMDAWLKSQQ